MTFNLFKILKGMFTPYVEPPKPDRIEPTISAKFFDGTSPGDTECQPSPNRNASKRKKRPTSRNTRRMNGRGFARSHAVFDNDDSGPSCSSSSSSSSDSGGGCGGGE